MLAVMASRSLMKVGKLCSSSWRSVRTDLLLSTCADSITTSPSTAWHKPEDTSETLRKELDFYW